MGLDLSRLTLVVPTCDRQAFVLRLMSFWAEKGPKVLVLDGSSRPLPHETLHRYSQAIQYVHSPSGLSARLSASLALITTEFVLLAGDDEFYMPSALTTCIHMLDREVALVACGGRAIGFTYRDGLLLGTPKYQSLTGYKIYSDKAEDRLCHHMRNYVPSLIYSVCRTDSWKTAFEFILKEEFPFFASGELQFEMFMSYAGRSMVIPELMWLRSLGENEPIRGSDPSLNPAVRLPVWWGNADFSAMHERFLRIMSTGFSKLLNYEGAFSDLRETVIKGVESYLEFCREQSRRKSFSLRLRGFMSALVSMGYSTHIKRLIHRLRLGGCSTSSSLLAEAKSLEDGGIHVDFNELIDIEFVIKSFYNYREAEKLPKGK